MGRLGTTVQVGMGVVLGALCSLSSGLIDKATAAVTDDTETPFSDMAPPPLSPGTVSSEVTTPETWNWHEQVTNVLQYHPKFASPYQGKNSLDPGDRNDETTDLTLFAGVRPWSGGEIYLDPEIDQGYGFNDTLGVAGFPSGEAYKTGSGPPYERLSRAFLRQVIGLGSAEQPVEPGANQLGQNQPLDNIILTIGKFSVVDLFDTNLYAHDPRADFLNWSVIDAGAFDYASDAWGYTYGSAVEWTQSWWTVRGGVFDLSRTPNSKDLEHGFGEFALVGELEERHQWFGQSGKIKLLGFLNRARMGNYSDAVRLAEETHRPPDTAEVRHYGSRPGVALNIEQALSPDLGLFGRASVNDGNKEAYDFTDIDRSLTAGLSLKGDRWNRPNDTWGLAGAANGLSNAARDYLAAGGLGILIGDGQLPHAGFEEIAETYYSIQAARYLTLSLDYQYIANPAYNRDRGPVSVFGLRIHAER